MNVKKIISGIIIIGMTFGLTGISFAGEKNNHRNNDKQVVKVKKVKKKYNHRQPVRVDNRHDNQRMKHGDRYYSRNDRHETERRNPQHVNKQSNRDNNTHHKVRTVVTPFGIFPIFW